MGRKQMGIGRCLDNNILAYVVPENYEDYFDRTLYTDPKCKFVEDADFCVDNGDTLIVTNSIGASEVITPGSVVLFDKHLNMVVDIYDSVEEAQEHYYVPGVLD